jgi:hypothetical protein
LWKRADLVTITVNKDDLQTLIDAINWLAEGNAFSPAEENAFNVAFENLEAAISPEPVQMFAFCSNQGTAMAETAICAVCLPLYQGTWVDKSLANLDIWLEWDNKPLVDCSENDQLRCQVCIDLFGNRE